MRWPSGDEGRQRREEKMGSMREPIWRGESRSGSIEPKPSPMASLMRRSSSRTLLTWLCTAPTELRPYLAISEEASIAAGIASSMWGLVGIVRRGMRARRGKRTRSALVIRHATSAHVWTRGDDQWDTCGAVRSRIDVTESEALPLRFLTWLP